MALSASTQPFLLQMEHKLKSFTGAEAIIGPWQISFIHAMGEGVEQEELDLGTTDLDKISLKIFYGNQIKNFFERIFSA